MPRSIRVRFQKPLSARPPVANKVSASENSATTSTRSALRRTPLVPVRPPSLRTSLRSSRVACQAGALPNKSPASVVTAIVKSKTGTLILMFASDGIIVPTGGITSVIASIIAPARKMPSAPPIAASTKLSVRNWANSRGREAPSAALTATSFCRDVPRANSRFATLTQPINRRNPTAPSNSQRLRRVEWVTKLRCKASTVISRLAVFGDSLWS